MNPNLERVTTQTTYLGIRDPVFGEYMAVPFSFGFNDNGDVVQEEAQSPPTQGISVGDDPGAVPPKVHMVNEMVQEFSWYQCTLRFLQHVLDEVLAFRTIFEQSSSWRLSSLHVNTSAGTSE